MHTPLLGEGTMLGGGSMLGRGPMGGGGNDGTPLLLDIYGGAISATSSRLLRTGYTGPCLKLRRSSDDAESDFGFLNGVLDTAAITAWLGGANGFIRTRYDQGTGANHLQMATAANQPAYVGAVSWGTLRPAMGFTAASSQYMQALFATQAQPVTRFCVFRASSIAAARTITDGAGGTACLLQASATQFLTNSGSALNAAASDTNAHQMTALNNGNNSVARIDGAGNVGAGGTNSLQSGVTVGASRTPSAYFQGEIGELLVYASDMSAHFAAIEANQKAFWGTP